MTEKHATKLGTAEYFRLHAVNQTKIRGLDDVSVSAMAVGTYLGDCTPAVDRQYEEALVLAAKNGVNFFDTAVNYRCQRSERNIAYAIRKLASEGISRDQIFVSTKGGFLPADGEPQEFQKYILKCFLNTGIIKPEDIVRNCHCMTPKYLESQINLSLLNLKIDTIDLYYLHNPETQLPVLGESKFYAALTDAFAEFEKHVADGKIKRYGVATWNGFREPLGLENTLSLEKIIACARAAGGESHHFKAIQLPYNLAMIEAVALRNQKTGTEDFPIIPAAVHHGISVLISAPLLQSNVLKIPKQIYDTMPALVTGENAQKALQFVMSTPGVTAAMVGMKQVSHVHENITALAENNWAVEDLQKTAKMLVRS